MYLIAGLGNPGKQYNFTRHNAGYETLDRVIDACHFDGPTTKHRAMIGQAIVGGEKVIAAKPLTFMNDSGAAIRAICDYYKIDPTTELVVISDDVDLPIGTVRIRKSGSDGGHNGLKSIIAHLGTQEFIRIRVGVGDTDDHAQMIKHVLGKFSKEDRALAENAYDRAAKAAIMIVTDGVDRAMNTYNGTA